MANPDILIPFELALRAYLESTGQFVAATGGPGFAIYCAHEAKLVTTPDFLVIIAGRPAGGLLRAGMPELAVEFQIQTSEIQNESKRADAVALHDARATALEFLLGDENFEAARAALNAAATRVGFTGWGVDEAANPAEADGRTDDDHLLTRLRYGFDVFLI